MKRILLTAALILVLAAAVSAQSGMKLNAFAGGGITIPTGDAGDIWKMGYGFGGGIGVMVNPMFSVNAKVFYNMLPYDTDAEGVDDATALSIIGDVHFYPPIGEPGMMAFNPYLIAGAGMTSVDPKNDLGDSETKFTFGFGAGFEYTVSPKMAIWVEGKYMIINMDDPMTDVKHIPIRGGLKFFFGQE